MSVLKALSAGLVLCVVAIAAAQAVDAPIERYRDAAALNERGTVKGRAFEERRRPGAPDTPLTGTAVALLPRSEAWLFRLEAIKRGARDSTAKYRQAATAVRQARDAYEKSLLEAGAGDLSQAATVDADGRFSLEGVPAGPWVLLAYRASYVNKTSPDRPFRTPGSASGRPAPFLPGDRLTGFSVITYWVREVNVAGGGVETVELTDRNAWLTGVVEDRQPPPAPDQPFQPRR